MTKIKTFAELAKHEVFAQFKIKETYEFPKEFENWGEVIDTTPHTTILLSNNDMELYCWYRGDDPTVSVKIKTYEKKSDTSTTVSKLVDLLNSRISPFLQKALPSGEGWTLHVENCWTHNYSTSDLNQIISMSLLWIEMTKRFYEELEEFMKRLSC